MPSRQTTTQTCGLVEEQRGVRKWVTILRRSVSNTAHTSASSPTKHQPTHSVRTLTTRIILFTYRVSIERHIGDTLPGEAAASIGTGESGDVLGAEPLNKTVELSLYRIFCCFFTYSASGGINFYETVITQSDAWNCLWRRAQPTL